MFQITTKAAASSTGAVTGAGVGVAIAGDAAIWVMYLLPWAPDAPPAVLDAATNVLTWLLGALITLAVAWAAYYVSPPPVGQEPAPDAPAPIPPLGSQSEPDHSKGG